MAPITNSFVKPDEMEMSGEAGEKVFITGMSGLYPESHNVKDLSNILYNKINPVNDKKSRWQYEHPEVAQYTGKVPGLMLFDAQFFKVHYRLGNNMDAMGRKILEQAYQAIYDAGISPVDLYGKKVGVYIGSCFSETEKACFYVASSRTGFGIAGCNKSMFANRISYWLNVKGPSMAIDEACCSSTEALELAYQDIVRGECEAAIVGGASLCLHPQSSIHYGRIMKLSMDGKTKSFDANAAGVSKSEAINVLFLQKAKNALRVYAEITHVKCEYTSVEHGKKGPKYGFYRNPKITTEFIKTFYDEANISPEVVEYVEAFGSAVDEADKAELEAIEDVFCKSRKEPLKVGSVMSNIGYGEAASGISAITKVLLAYHTGKIAANMHCDSPRKDILALRDGRMRIVTEHESFNHSYTAVNGLSVTGVNTHVLLKGHHKPKDLSRYKVTIPQLVTLSARQESAVIKIVNDLKSRPVDPEELALLRNIHKTNIMGHMGRGYVVLDTNEEGQTVSLSEKTDYFDEANRPLWFMYSGMGSQWAGMGAQLMRIPVFAAAIERCHRVLEPKGIDIVHIITTTDKNIFDNILHSFVGIAAVQIGLTDILTALGVIPDKIIGHSVGELGCAYADGCFTAEEMILSAYSRGLVSLQTPFIKGSMAAVGIGYQQIVKMCPPEIEVACHNGPQSSTISGPANEMKEFVAYLTSKGVFAKEVPCSNIAYHSRYIAEAGPGLLKYLSDVIKSPKPRSEKWVSTSVPQERWGEDIAKYCSPQYHTNNLLSSVLFEETSRLIPANAVVVEIAPHGLLQAIVKRSLPETCSHIPLTRRGHLDNAQFLLDAIGKLYMHGYNPKVEAIYPKVDFPVSSGTPMLSHLVEWAHNEKWNLPLYVSAHKQMAAATKFVVSTQDDENAFLKGHIIREQNLYPFSAVLVALWDTLAMVIGAEKKHLSVEFSEVHFHSQPVLHDQQILHLNISLHRGTGRFEVLDENISIMSGFITGEIKKTNSEPKEFHVDEVMKLKSDDVYKLLSTRHYNYSGEFRSISNTNLSVSEAYIKWNNNWVTVLDGMLQLNMLRRTNEAVSQLNYIRKIKIDVEQHSRYTSSNVDGVALLPAKVFDVQDCTRCAGILMENIRFYDLPSVNKNIGLKARKFVPHFSTNSIDKITALSTFVQIVAENLNKQYLNVVEIFENKSDFEELAQLISGIPRLNINYSGLNREATLSSSSLPQEIDLVLVTNLSNDDNLCQLLHRNLKNQTFVVNYGKHGREMLGERASSLFRSVCGHIWNSTIMELVALRPNNSNEGTSAITVSTESDLALLTSRLSAIPLSQRLILLTSYPPLPGLKLSVKKWRMENKRKINLVLINNKFSNDHVLDNINLTDLAVNILENGEWGGEYYITMEENYIRGQNLQLEIERVGDLNSLLWTEASESSNTGIDVKVHYAGVNDIEVKKKMGTVLLNNDDIQVFDFSGTTKSGARVMGIATSESIKTQVKVIPELLWPVPAHWSMEDAATVPLAYSLALYCLCIKSSLKPGLKMLVHGGAGALGQAVISIALAFGCEVFTTVSDNKKKRFLRKLFPELKESHIGSSLDNSFGDMVLYATKGNGCNLIISCVKGDLKDASIKCCVSSGVVVDTTLLLNKEKYDFGMKHLHKGISYATLNLCSILEINNIEEIQKLQLMLSDGITRGYIRPLSRISYPALDAPRAFSLQAGRRHRGRVLLNLQNDLLCKQTRISCSPQLGHLVVSEDELLALKLVDRLVNRGAKKVLLSMPEPTECLSMKLRLWKNKGVQVEVLSWNVFKQSTLSFLDTKISLPGIEGLYYIVTGNPVREDSTNILEHINSISQKTDSTLKYITVINVEKDEVGEKAMSKIESQKLLNISLPTLKFMQQDDNEVGEVISAVNAIDAIEKALCLKQRNVLVHSLPEASQFSFEQEFARIAEISIPEDINEDTNVTDLGVDHAKLEIFRVFLRNQHHILLEESDMSQLTIKKLRALEHKISGKEYEETKGLKTFYSYIGDDELLSTTEMVFLQTMTTSSATRDDEFDTSQTFLCVVPGVEGLHSRFETLCERLKVSALVLQPGLDNPNETIKEIAERYTEVLLTKTKLNNRFYLLGYESGVLIALEMAAILEDQGLKGTVFCIGGAPNEIQDIFEEELKHYKTEEDLQNAIIRHMFNLMSIEHTEDLTKALLDNFSWDQKVSLCIHLLREHLIHSNQYATELINAAYERIVQARKYKVDPRKLQSLLVSIQPLSKDNHRAKGNVSALQKHSVKKVVEYQLKSLFAFAAQDLQCSAIINRHLDKDLLEAFDKKNTCETYLLSSDSFMNCTYSINVTDI